MRILMLTQWFDPEPMFKGLSFAKELVKRGHTVEVLTGFPNYPGGKVYPGYRAKLWQREMMDGIRVNRVFLYPSHDGNGARRIANYLSFAFSTAALGPLLVHKPDVVYVYNLITLGWAARLLRMRYGCPIVYDVQDLWPESVLSSGMMRSGLLGRILQNWCDRTYRSADRLTVLSPGFKRTLAARGVDEKRIEVIYNWCEDEMIVPAQSDLQLADSIGMTDRFNVVFAGTIGKGQALEAVLGAAELLKDRCPGVQFVFVGGGTEVDNLKHYATTRRLNNVRFLPRKPKSEIGAILNLADVLLVHLREAPLYHITIPSKTQAYMAVGKPILMGVQGDAADLIAMASSGVSCRPEVPQNIAEAVFRLYAMSPEERKRMGTNGRDFYAHHLSKLVGVAKLETILCSAANHTH